MSKGYFILFGALVTAIGAVTLSASVFALGWFMMLLGAVVLYIGEGTRR